METAEVRASWTAPEDMPALQRVVDEATGTRCLQYAEDTPLQARTFYTEFDRAVLDDHDTLRFRWKRLGDTAQVRVTVHGYPGPDDRRNYYLSKRPSQRGQWQDVWLDLHHDDDGGTSEAAEGKVRVSVNVKLWDLGELSEQPRVVLRLADLRFERHPIRLGGDLEAVRNITDTDGGRIGQRYPLTVTNRSDRPQVVRLAIEPAALDEFAVDRLDEPLELEPGQTQRLDVAITVPADRADELPPLYSESASVFAVADEAPNQPTTWYHGFTLRRLIGALPAETGASPWFYGDDRRSDVLARIERQEGAQAAFERVIEEADALLKVSPEPPALLHGNPIQFFDPRTDSPLRFHGPGRIWSDKQREYIDISELPERVQRAAAYAHHRYLADGAHTLALAAWLTEREDYAAKARDILLAYAQRYRDYPRMNPSSVAFFSRVGWAMLQEAWWFDPIPEAFDLLRASQVLSDEEDRQILEGLIVPAMLTLRTHRVAANQQAEVNAAYGRAALVARRWDRAAEAFHGEAGIRAQWRREFDADGLTMEREMPYHFAAVMPFVEFARCLQAMGVPAFDLTFKRLFDAPLAYSIDQRAGVQAWVYEQAYAHYKDEGYLPQVRRARAGRWSLASLLSPIDELPESAEGETRYGNSVMSASGFTVLRTGRSADDLRAVTMNWGSASHRGGNVLLNPEFVWRGQPLNEQVKRIGYSYDQSHFSYTAAAGNSIVVDGKRHSMLRATQDALIAGDPSHTPAGRWTSPRQRPLYAGVAWSRSTAICGNTVVLIDQLRADRPRRFDWFTYLPGEVDAVSSEAEETPFPAFHEQGDGYEALLEPRIAGESSTSTPFVFDYRLGKDAATPMGQLTLLSSDATLIRARGWIHWHPRQVPVIVQRADEAEAAWFVAAYTGRADDSVQRTKVERLTVEQDGRTLQPEQALAVRINNAEGRFLVLTASSEGEYDVAGTTMIGPLAVQRLDE